MNANKKPYKTIEETPIFNLAHQFVISVYKTTTQFPKSELFGLTSQLRRSVSSVPANITEGFYRSSNKELMQFLFVARGSLGEALYHLRLGRDLQYIYDKQFEGLLIDGNEIGKQLNAWISSIKRRTNS